jgi:hypothetical protein
MHDPTKELVYQFRASRNSRPVLLLGAGASFRSGIPMAAPATKEIAREAYARQELGLDARLANPKLTDWLPWLQKQPWFIAEEERLADNFPLAVEHLLRPDEFRREILTEMIKPRNGINSGYRDLAKLVHRRLCWTILTTNFDHNITDALREQRPHIPEIVEINRTDDDLIRFNIYHRCQVIYLHGAVEFYRDKNLPAEVARLDDRLVQLVRPLLRDSPLIVIGYRGSEPSVMKHLLEEGLTETNNYRHGIFWCLRRGDQLHENVQSLRAKIASNFRLIEIDGFDELLELLERELTGETWLPHSSAEVLTKPANDPSLIEFDHRALVGASLADLDLDLALSTLITYCTRLRIPQVTRDNYLSLMQEQGLLVKQEDKLVPTIGCFLLFGQEVADKFPHARVAFTTGGKKRQVFDGNLIEQFRKLITHLNSDEVNPSLRVKSERSSTERQAYQPRALTELIVNLLVHRDYQAEDYSYINFEPGQYLRFTNPGGLMPRVRNCVSVDEAGRFQPVRHASELRNKSLADIFWGLGPMDKDGSGLADVQEGMAEYGGAAEFAITENNQSMEITLLQPRQTSPSRSRVAKPVSSSELYITNLLPFRVIPSQIHCLPLREKPLANLPLFEQDESPRDFPVFIETGEQWISFADWRTFPKFAERHGYLEEMNSPMISDYFAGSEQQKPEDRRRHFVWLVGKHWEFYLQRFFAQGLFVERKQKRAYFQIVKGERNTIIYNSRLRKGVKRDVVKRRGEEQYIWHENEGIGYAVVNFGETWAMQIKPFYMFTGKDGCTPLPSFQRTRRATRRMKFDRNKNVDDDLSFWARFLSSGQSMLSIGGVGVEDLIIDADFCSEEVPLIPSNVGDVNTKRAA